MPKIRILKNTFFGNFIFKIFLLRVAMIDYSLNCVFFLFSYFYQTSFWSFEVLSLFVPFTKEIIVFSSKSDSFGGRVKVNFFKVDKHF